jgi:hypothetical protein
MNTKYIAAFIIFVSVIIGATSSINDSPVVDEIPHIGSGYSYIQQGTYEMNPEHPPLAKDLAGISLTMLGIKDTAFAMPHPGYWPTDIHGQWNLGRNLIFNSGNNADMVMYFARLPLLLFFIFTAIIIFAWTRKLYGDRAALIALFLFSFSPTVIAHGRLVTTDMAALFGTLLCFYWLIKYIKNQTIRNLFIAGLAFGVAQLTKFSLVLVIPIFVILPIIWGLAHKNLRIGLKTFVDTCLIIIIGYVVIVWPVYGLHVRNYLPIEQRSDATNILKDYGYDNLRQPTLQRKVADVIIWSSDKPIIRPLAEYALGVLMVVQRNAGGNQTYFFGQVTYTGTTSYFPIVYFIKEPLAFWSLILMALIGMFWLTKRYQCKNFHSWIKDHFAGFAMLLWLILYWYTSISAHLNIGVRHLLPTYGFIYILASGQISRILEHFQYNKKLYGAFSIIIGLLLGWYLLEMVRVYPYYLTYFNQTVGGPSGGYRYVVDSNVDWGQDLKRVAIWADDNKIPKIYLDYFGWSDPSYYLKDKYGYMSAGLFMNKKDFLNKNPKGGYIAVSATFYAENLKNKYKWLSEIPRLTAIGNSIFVWHINP